MISFYKGTKQNTGSACQIWYSTSERGVFVEILKQHGWDASKGPNGVGTFKESKSNPAKRILLKLTIEEMAEVLQMLDTNSTLVSQNLAAKKFNEQVAKFNEAITARNVDLTAKAQTPLLKYLPLPVIEYKKFSGFHKASKHTTQIFINPWDKDETQYVMQLVKKDLENTTDTGKVSISILLKDREARVLKEYLTVGIRDILIYRPEEGKSDKNTKGVNSPPVQDVPISEAEPEPSEVVPTQGGAAPF